MNYHTTIQQQLDKIKQENQGRSNKQILILGAGMAGLAAGYELAQLGHRVEIWEGSPRLGGRVWTHRFKNGQYGEFGAMRIPASHDYTRHYLNELGLTLRPFINSHPETYRDFEGIVCKAKDAAQKIGKLFNLSRRDREAIANDGLDGIFLRIMSHLLSYLDKGDRLQLFGNCPLSDQLNYFDSQSLLQTLHNYTDTHDAVRLMGKATILEEYWHYSTAMFIREEIDEAFSGLEEICGGMDKLPNALADAVLPDGTKLRDHIVFNREVCSINQDNEGVTIKFKQNSNLDQKTYPYVLCTIPFSVLRRMDLHMSSGSKKIQDAIQGLGYQSSTKVLVNCTKRFWELEDNIFGGASLTDSIARMTFYPSDNAELKEREISQEAGVLLGSYTWGATARRLGTLNLQERGKVVCDKIKRFHPQIGNYLDSEEPYASMAWDWNKWSAGAFASSKPLDLQRFFPEVNQPAARLFFAGEHLSPYSSWIQGALWSALQGVMQIVLA